MTESELTLNLIRFRFIRIGINNGMSTGEAAILAEQHMKNQGLYGFLSKTKIKSTPEGSIVHIVKTYLQLVLKYTMEDHKLGQLDVKSAAYSDDTSNINKKCFRVIEDNRKMFCGGVGNYPTTLKEYVAYRVGLELRHLHKINAADLGLDHEATDNMVLEAVTYFSA